jgi:hypothetical protein
MSASRVGGAAVGSRHALTFLVGIRSCLAVSTQAAPRVSGRVFGIDLPRQPAAPYLARLFGLRNGVLALGLARLDALRQPRTSLKRHPGSTLPVAVSCRRGRA